MMSGVNNAINYIELMRFGHAEAIDGSGGILSVYFLVTLVWALAGGWVGEKAGQIKTIALGATWGILEASLQCSAQNHIWMIFARLINGFISGILNAIVPVWATESVPQTGRDQFVAIEFTLNIFRVVVAYLNVLAEAEFQDIRSVSQLKKDGNRTSYWSTFAGRSSGDLDTGRRVQLVIWFIARFNAEKSQWVSGLNNIFYMFSTLICVFNLDRIGRRWTLCRGTIGQGIAIFLAGEMSRLAINNSDAFKALQYGAAAAFMAFIFTWSAWGVVGWSIGNGWFCSKINDKTLYVFAINNEITHPDEMVLLFAAKTPWVWDAERNFVRLKEEHPEIAHAAHKGQMNIVAEIRSVA
ncbi:uncharacterized protein K444DRAFT_648512 [Hyaloscypha bicolor E]|uniref:MFS general substrate transporter n=1 Tax=Hyaloscypha bicolor E TaxID=1095630 RepID=A0A2J6SIX4_9HELO|nr:uncharacterized protein K444DRAFT_648512 [Hyaloscypha bicolor E]PMD50718.1 hypothetical protein K444DRAFT_648512 [Hyaloscypha bicolor E]